MIVPYMEENGQLFSCHLNLYYFDVKGSKWELNLCYFDGGESKQELICTEKFDHGMAY